MNYMTDINGSKSNLDEWGKIFLALAGLLLFIYIIGPMGLETPMIKPMADFIETSNINANGYYYTDVAEFSDAEMYMKNSMRYAPGTSK